MSVDFFHIYTYFVTCMRIVQCNPLSKNGFSVTMKIKEKMLVFCPVRWE